MESFVVKIFQVIFKLVVILMMSGTLVSIMSDLKNKAFHSKSMGLPSMSKINKQLVGDKF